MRKTKIICTLGPAVDDTETIKRLLKSGVNACRLNFSHGTHDQHKARLDRFKAVRKALGIAAASILDTKGPEIRIKTFEEGSVTLREGDTFTITTEDVTGNRNRVSTTYENLHAELKPGHRILLDDGLIELKVTEISGRDIRCAVVSGGTLSDQGMNKPVRLLPSFDPRARIDFRGKH